MQFLKKSSEYKSIYKEHKKVKGTCYTLLLQYRDGGNTPAFGIIVRKKVGKAVIRNKIKRRIRAYLRNMAECLPDNISGIIIAGDNAGKKGWQETINDLTACLKEGTGIDPSRTTKCLLQTD